MFNEEFEYDEVTSFLSSIENFSKVRRQREIKDEGDKAEVQKSYYKHRRFEERPPYASSALHISKNCFDLTSASMLDFSGISKSMLLIAIPLYK
jgi:hypothetical protein